MTLREAAQQALALIQAQQEWINAVPKDTQLPTMPGYDMDWADGVVGNIHAALAQPESEPSDRDDLTTAYLSGWHKGRADGIDENERVNALLAQQVAVPSGYVLVPIEPTQSMKEAMTKIIDLYYNPANKKQMYKAAHAYKAMLKAHAIEQAVRGKT